MKKVEKSIEFGGRTLKLSTGDLAEQADGAVLASCGETVVLATVVAAPLKVDLGYFPLTVEYQEKLFAGGRIKGSRWIKREGRPTDEEILTARLIDRSIRPLFPKEYKKDVQVITTVLSIDLENPPEVIAPIAVSAAIEISSIPWSGPVGIINIGLKDGKFITNPTENELATSEMDLIVSSTKDAIVMIEAGVSQVPEEKVIEGIAFAQKECQKILDLIKDLAKEVKKEKEEVEKKKSNTSLQKSIESLAGKEIEELIVTTSTKEAGNQTYDELKRAVTEKFEGEEASEAANLFDDLFKEKLRKLILSGKRPDGRRHDEIRPLSAAVSVLPRTHGSALFQRGQTQALSTATLGAQSLELFIETASGEETKRYIHLYSMPPFATGEAGKVGAPNRREIGHGALAERALIPVIPSEEDFPYTIQVVSEILSSNGSTSMASVCGSTLSLMDAGVPIKSPIAGIAMGLIIEDDKSAVLTDIVGIEDGCGDMDFKIAGSASGITALQLDVKTLKLTLPILEKAIKQAKEARMEILKVITKAINKPRETVSKYAPKIKLIRIPQDKIGELIGPGGRTIKKIIAETNCQIDVDDDGVVHIAGTTKEELEAGISRVEAITKEPKAGEIYEGEVKRLLTFGAFVEILPGKEGLVHVSDMSGDFVKDPSDLLKVGDKLQVRVKGVDEMGRLNLSMMLDPAFDAMKEERRKERGGVRSDRDRGRRFDSGRGRFDKFEKRGTGGPHFPKSRFIDESKKRYS